MVYISSGGQIGGSHQWGLSTIPNIFWGCLNFIVLFFQTLFNPNLTKRGDGYLSSYRSPGGSGPPPGPPRRRMGGLFRYGGAGPPPMAGGG